MSYSAKLWEQRCELATSMQKVLEDSEGRSMSPEETQKFDKMDADLVAIDEKHEKAKLLESRAKPVETLQVAEQPRREVAKVETRAERIDTGELLRGWLLAPNGKATPKQMELMQRAGINPSINELELRFDRHGLDFPRSEREARRRLEERVYEKRALDTTVDETGGFVVPDDMMAAIEVALLAYGTMRQTSSIINSSFGGPLPIPTSDDTTNVGEILAENAQVNEQDVAFGQRVLGAFKYSSKMVRVSVEMMQDSSVNMNTFLGSRLGERLGRITNAHFTTGAGTTEPFGIVTEATDSTVAFDSTTAVTWEELITFEHTVDPAYRNQSAAWMGSDAMLAQFKRITDGEGRPLWLPSLQVNAPDRFLGYPFQINQSVAVPAAGATALLFGDLSKYIIRDVLGFTLLRLTERYADYHQVAFLAFSRHDGLLLDAGTNPVKYAKMAAA